MVFFRYLPTLEKVVTKRNSPFGFFRKNDEFKSSSVIPRLHGGLKTPHPSNRVNGSWLHEYLESSFALWSNTGPLFNTVWKKPPLRLVPSNKTLKASSKYDSMSRKTWLSFTLNCHVYQTVL